MIFGDLVQNDSSTGKYIKFAIKERGCYPHEVDSETIGQYTGLNDVNGKEIYEGDLIDMITPNVYKRYKTRTYVIKWDRFKWVAIAIDGQFKQVFPKNFTDTERTKAEVIGNIYENQELLNND